MELSPSFFCLGGMETRRQEAGQPLYITRRRTYLLKVKEAL
jgi:hypothetical protein